MGFRSRFYSPYRTGHKWLSFFLFLSVGILLVWIVSSKLYPRLEKYASSEVSCAAGQVIEEAVHETILEQDMSYPDLVSLIPLQIGDLVILYSNTPFLNRMKAEILYSISEEIDKFSKEELKIPLGSISSFSLFQQAGPLLGVRMEASGEANVSIDHEFLPTGRQQVLHRLILTAEIPLNLSLLGSTTHIVVHHSLLLAEATIIRTVPDGHLYFSPGL